jgi:hypothetical protein
MRQIKNFMTREDIRKDIESMTNSSPSPAELEYQAQQYWDSHEYEIGLGYISKAIELNPSHYSLFKRSQCYYQLHEYDYQLQT